MKKRLIALLLVLILVVPAGIASAATWYRVNTSSLKVHYMAGENSKVLGSYRKDYACKILSKSDGWAYVQFSNGVKGYVMSKYLSKASSHSAWIYSDNTSLRKGPDGGFSAIAKLARGTKVSVLSQGSKYSYVSAGSFGTGYVVNSLLSSKKVASSGSSSTSNATVNANYNAWIMGTGKIKLMKSASSKAAVVAKYSPGTKVHVTKKGPDWCKVTVGGNTGWIPTKNLTTQAPAETPTPKPSSGKSTYTAYVVTGNKKPVNVRKGNSKNYTVIFKIPHGAKVTVLKHGNWDYIEYGGRKGYVQTSFLQTSKPSGSPVPEPTKKPAFQQYEATITSANGKSVNFHRGRGEGYSNVGCGRLKVGTTVKVLKHDNGWAQIQYKSWKGWVRLKFLKKK